MGDGLAHSASGAFEGFEIFIKYLPVDTQAKPLREYFAPAGQIVGEPRLMMHPQTVFRCHSSYVEWLDDFRAECGELEDYEVRFIHFQDLVALSATAAAGGGGETTGNTD